MIKIDMDMPKHCAVCPFLGDTLGKINGRVRQHFYCSLSGYIMPAIDIEAKKHTHCPLIPIKEKTDD